MSISREKTLTDLPRDLLLYKVGLFAGVPAMRAMANSCRRLYEVYKTVLTPAANLGHLISRGRESEARALLEAAKANGTLKELLATPATITHSLTHDRTITLTNIKVPQYALWSLEKRMFALVTEFLTEEELNLQLQEHTAQDAPDYVKTHGLHISARINQCWDNFHAHTRTIVWKDFQENSAEDLECQRLFKEVIAAQAELSTHFLSELLHPTRSIVEHGKVRHFNDVHLPRILSLSDGTSFNSLKANSEFGETYGLLCKLHSAVRANVSQASTYARTKLKVDDNTYLRLTELNAEVIKKLLEARLSWYTNVITKVVKAAEPIIASPRLSNG